MRRHAWLFAAVALACLVLTMAAFSASEKKTQNANISCEENFTYNWKTGLIVFRGDCRLEVKGPEKAILTTQRLSAKFGQGNNRVDSVTAQGPVHFDVTTEPDAEGVRRHITADCRGEATFDGKARVVKLTGGAEAVMMPVPAPPGTQPAKLSGPVIEINLATSEMNIEGSFYGEFEIPAAQPKPTE